jgi:hypothetical protein
MGKIRSNMFIGTMITIGISTIVIALLLVGAL